MGMASSVVGKAAREAVADKRPITAAYHGYANQFVELAAALRPNRFPLHGKTG
jgi:hypothetical protein